MREICSRFPNQVKDEYHPLLAQTW